MMERAKARSVFSLAEAAEVKREGEQVSLFPPFSKGLILRRFLT